MKKLTEFTVAAASVAPLDARVVAYFDLNRFAHNTSASKTVRNVLVHFFNWIKRSYSSTFATTDQVFFSARRPATLSYLFIVNNFPLRQSGRGLYVKIGRAN